MSATGTGRRGIGGRGRARRRVGPKRIGVLGAGPAGLYFAMLAKKADPSRQITVVERNPAGATYGWGVVFSEETLGALRDADRESYQRITDSFAKWTAIDIRYRGELIRSRGHVFSGTSRRGLLMLLQERCRELGVELAFEREVPSLEAFAGDSDLELVVAADGVNSTVRRDHADWFRPSMDVHATKFAWFGTDKVFDAFTFLFRETPHGMFQVHAYPFDAQTSTFIVETHASTWERAGLDRMSEAESIAFCEELFAEDLAGRKLLSNRSLWVGFVTLRCESWHRGNVVLVGDAAHTAHFTIGSGTKLAMEDAVALANALEVHRGNLEAALTDYELERQPVVERFQEAARDSATYFESVGRYAGFEPVQFAFNLLTRSGRITHLELEKRDPSFVARVDAAFSAEASWQAWTRFQVPAERVVAPPPLLAPLRLGTSRSERTVLVNRVAVSVDAGETASDGEIGEALVERLIAAGGRGAGLVVAGPVAVSAEGRAALGTPGLWSDEQAEGWRNAVDAFHRPAIDALLALLLGHAGRRGSSRPRGGGVDRPLRDDGWETVAPSPIPYSPRRPPPRAITSDEMVKIADEFATATTRADSAGVPALLLDMAHGYLLASFLSPLANRRTDGFGGSLESRMRFPLQVFEALRLRWPQDRPLGVRLNATDWMPGGFDVEDAIVVASALKQRGCDLIDVAAGQTVSGDRPDYGRLYLVPFADRIRNEAGLPVMVGGSITKPDDVNTILAAGRADLCLIDPRTYSTAG